MQAQHATIFDDGFGTPILGTGVVAKLLYFFYDRMPSGVPGWENYGGDYVVPEY